MKEVFLADTVRKMVLVDTIEKVKHFITLTNTCPCDIDIISGRHNVNAKSIMGMFSINLDKPIELRIYDTDKADKVIEILKEFIVDVEPPAVTDPYEKVIIL